MSRYEELQLALFAASEIYSKHQVMCHASAWHIYDELQIYIGTKQSRLFKWGEDDVSSEHKEIRQAGVWEDSEEPEMIVGLSFGVEVDVKHRNAQCRQGFKLSLKPRNNKVTAIIDDEVSAELVIVDEILHMKFIDDANKDRLLGYVFDTLKKVVSVPMHKRKNGMCRMGFPTGRDD